MSRRVIRTQRHDPSTAGRICLWRRYFFYFLIFFTFQGLWHTVLPQGRSRGAKEGNHERGGGEREMKAERGRGWQIVEGNNRMIKTIYERLAQWRSDPRPATVKFRFMVCIKYTSWPLPGNRKALSHRNVVFYIWSHFLLDADWEGWGTVLRAAGRKRAWRIFSGDAPRRQTQ